MTITIAALRPSLERHLAERVAAGDVRVVGAHEYRVTGGRVRVQVRPERRLHAVVSFTATRSSRGLTVQAIEMDYDAALTAAVIRYLLNVGIGVDFSVSTVAFSGAVLTDGDEPTTPTDPATFEWR